MSEHPPRGTLRIVGGASTARVLVETGGNGRRVAVPDTESLAVERAREQGFHEGQAAARAECEAREAELVETVARLAEQLPDAWSAQLERFEEKLCGTLVDLAFQIAERLVRSPALSAEAVRSAVDEALALPLIDGQIEVRCHPADCTRLGRHPSVGSAGRLRFVPDPRLEPGDARIETPETGDLDGRLAGRLRILRERLETVVLSPPAES